MDSTYIEWVEECPAPLLGRIHEFTPKSFLTPMESGRIRVRRAFETSLQLFSARWNFTQDQFEAFEAFFITGLEQGSQSFWLTTNEVVAGGERQDVTRLLAFFDAHYTFTRSDNLYSVAAVLQVREQNIVAPDPCKIVLTGGFGGGDSLDCYPENLPMTGLSSGSLSGSWTDRPLWISIWCLDTLDTYEDDTPMNGLDHDLLWGGPWVDRDLTGV